MNAVGVVDTDGTFAFISMIQPPNHILMYKRKHLVVLTSTVKFSFERCHLLSVETKDKFLVRYNYKDIIRSGSKYKLELVFRPVYLSGKHMVNYLLECVLRFGHHKGKLRSPGFCVVSHDNYIISPPITTSPSGESRLQIVTDVPTKIVYTRFFKVSVWVPIASAVKLSIVDPYDHQIDTAGNTYQESRESGQVVTFSFSTHCTSLSRQSEFRAKIQQFSEYQGLLIGECYGRFFTVCSHPKYI